MLGGQQGQRPARLAGGGSNVIALLHACSRGSRGRGGQGRGWQAGTEPDGPATLASGRNSAATLLRARRRDVGAMEGRDARGAARRSRLAIAWIRPLRRLPPRCLDVHKIGCSSQLSRVGKHDVA